MINYCLPIIKQNKTEIFEIIEKNISEYQYFEVWLDYVEESDEAFITKLTNLLGEKLIVLFRRQNMEPMITDLEHRFNIIALLSNTNTFLDLDITQQEELEHIERNNMTVNLIVSYHNYENTPDDGELKNTVQDMEYHKPAIYKIATMCQNKNDALRLLQLQQELKTQNKRHIVLGMGEFGTITRVFGTLWGNEMIFAPKNAEEASAPGQLTKSQLDTVFRVLESRIMNYGFP